MLNIVFTLLAGLAAAYLGLMVMTWLLADSIIFPVPPSTYTDAPNQPKLSTADGQEVTAVYLPNPAATHVLLFAHGNKMDLGKAEERLQAYRAHGWSVFAYDFPGYGTSTGAPSEAGCYAAQAAAYAYLTRIKQIPPDKIVLYGLSLGGGPSVDLASREPIGGIILEGAFLSAFRVITRWRVLPWDYFDNIAKIAQVRAPLLSIHAQEDKTVPFIHGKLLNEAHPGPKSHLWVKGAGHNNILEIAPADYWDALERFRASLTNRPATSPA